MKKRALLSVADKRGLLEFARGLTKVGFELIATGGTRTVLEENGIASTPAESVTGFPECFGGRVKTMHPAITGGILFRRDNAEDLKEVEKLGIEPIDLIAINLYPFEQTVAKADAKRSTTCVTRKPMRKRK